MRSEISDAFDNYTHSLGGRASRAEGEFFHSLREHAEVMCRNIAATRRVCFDYVDNEMFNAVAFRGRDSYSDSCFVGIYVGAALILHDVLLRILSHPTALKEIGDPSQESIQFSHLYDGCFPFYGTSSPQELMDEMQHGPLDLLDFAHALKTGEFRAVRLDPFSLAPLAAAGLPSVIPHDPARDGFARFAAHCGLRWLVAHELSHLILGHLDFLEEHTGAAALMEINAETAIDTRLSGLLGAFDRLVAVSTGDLDMFFRKARQPLGMNTRQALEAHADARASCIEATFIGSIARDSAAMGEGAHSWQLRPDLTMRAAALGIILCFRLFNPGGTSVGTRPTGTHPHPAVRSRMCVDRIRAALVRSADSATAEAFAQSWRATLDDLESCWREFGFRRGAELDEYEIAQQSARLTSDMAALTDRVVGWDVKD